MIHANLMRCWAVLGLALFLTACAFPGRDYSLVPDASVIEVQLADGRWVAVPPECSKLFSSPPPSRYDSRPQVAFGCATYTNLANSVARPRDLVYPASYAGQQPDSAAAAVTRYRENKITPIKESRTTTKSGQ